MVFRCFVEKKKGFDIFAKNIESELISGLGISQISSVRVFNRYDFSGVDPAFLENVKNTVLSEPPVDICYDEVLPEFEDAPFIYAVESLPGQYDQRADSAAQCIQILLGGNRPVVRSGLVYVIFGVLSQEDKAKIRDFLVNPVETREASGDKPLTLEAVYPEPDMVRTLDGFTQMNEKELQSLLDELGLAMDLEDLKTLHTYFQTEGRNPTITEIKMVDTYWSDHCRHTTFLTHITDAEILDEQVKEAYELYKNARYEVYGEKAATRPETLMDIATIGAKLLKKRGLLKNLDESEEINACSIKTDILVNKEPETWLLMFKNETHNHPTEIEPFGGAATCLGGAIRDPLSGRSYVFGAMRVTGSADPRVPLSETMKGKLPQRKITTTAAAGYSSYGNQIGLATGLVSEHYHPGYVAKRLEIGAVVGAAPVSNVRRERPCEGDVVILLGGRTGRDGCGGATGSSKTHTLESLAECGSEVQKGNPPEERKIQRLFRNPAVCRMIKRCNDFGAGGVSVAIGELADGLLIDLDKVPKKYEGLDGTELAISESQERMAVVIESADAERFMTQCAKENIEATVVAKVTAEPRLKMNWRGRTICDISREFLDTNGAFKTAQVKVNQYTKRDKGVSGALSDQLLALAGQLNVVSQRGLGERFDATIGAGTVVHPFGGKNQETPAQALAMKFPVLHGETDTMAVMSYGFDPYLSEENPYEGAELAVISSLSKLVAAGCDYKNAYLTLQEYFERLKDQPERWGKPFAALLGALKAQTEMGVAAIGGKDSMSGSFMDIDVPPTLVSFAIVPEKVTKAISGEFKAAGNNVYLFKFNKNDYQSVKDAFDRFMAATGRVKSAYSVVGGGVLEAILKMSFGNDIGFEMDKSVDPSLFTEDCFGALVAEIDGNAEGILLGKTSAEPAIVLDQKIPLSELFDKWSKGLTSVFKTTVNPKEKNADIFIENTAPAYKAVSVKTLKPKAIIPVFPGTNCEYDTARAVERAGGEAEIFVVKNLTGQMLEDSVNEFSRLLSGAQMLILPGGFSGGDEPDGSGKFIVSFLKNSKLKEGIHELLYKRDGLALGICNGFQALVKLGLVPYGEIVDVDENSPTLTFNLIGRHQSRFAYTKVVTAKSPWLSKCNIGEVYSIPMSHGEGRFVAPEEVLKSLAKNGQIATQYVDFDGNPSMDIRFNPNGSLYAIEGICSPDGRVLGKMGHSERVSDGAYMNIIGNKNQPIFESGVDYFRI